MPNAPAATARNIFVTLATVALACATSCGTAHKDPPTVTPHPAGGGSSTGSAGGSGTTSAGNNGGSGTAGGSTAGSNTGAPGPAPISADSGNVPANPNEPYALIGRFDTSQPNALSFNWPNSAIGVAFSGTGLTANLADGFVADWLGTPVHTWFDIEVDGGQPTVMSLATGKTQYALASNLPPGNHVLWLRKRTESQVGTAVFSGFVPAQGGALLGAPAYRKRRILAVGTSSMTGYGADANVTAANMCSFSDSTENADFSYPKLLADQLDAELTNLSHSGKGITRNITDGDPDTLPVIYHRILADDSGSVWTQPAGGLHDVVLIDAGGDDLVGDWGAGVLDANAFISKYVAFLQTLRHDEPRAPIFACLTAGAGGNDRVTLRNAITAAVSQATAAGVQNVSFFEFPGYDGSMGYGCDYHDDHAAAAWQVGLILPQIRAKTGW